MKNFKRNTIAALSCAAGLMIGMANAYAQEKVMIGVFNSAGVRVAANLIKIVIEEKLGGEAEIVPSSHPVVFQGMHRGKGDIDVHPDVWLPNLQNLTDKYVDKLGTVALSKGSYVGTTGFCVNTEIAEKHNLKTIFDLGTPEAAALFDSDGDGRGEIWAGAPGWAATNINLVKLRDYGVSNFFTATKEEQETAVAKIGTSITKGKGVAFYCWEPHYINKLYDITKLKEPEFDANKYKMIQPGDDPDWFEHSKITTGDKPKTIRVAYSRSLETRAPSVAMFLSNFDLETEIVNAWTHDFSVLKKPAEEIAATWAAENSAIIDGWLGL